MKKLLSIIIPVKNEEETIGKVLKDLKKVLKKINYRWEIIIVDDGSEDKTRKILQKFKKEKNIKVFFHKKNLGKGVALLTGFSKAKGEILAMMDGDYSHIAEDLPYLLTELERGRGLVVGSRLLGWSEENEPIRFLFNIFVTILFALFFKQFITDTLNGYKVFKREVFDNFKFSSKDFEIEIELLAKTKRSGLTISEIASHERARAGGKAKSKFYHALPILLKIFQEGIKYRLNASN